MKRRRLITIAILLFLFLLSIPIIYRLFGERIAIEIAMGRAGASRQTRADFEQWRTQKVNLPAGIEDVAIPLSEKTLILARAFRLSEEQLLRRYVHPVHPISDFRKRMDQPVRSSLTKQSLEDTLPLGESYAALVEQDDFNANCTFPGDICLANHLFAPSKLLGEQALALHEEGRTTEALRLAVAPIRSVTHEQFENSSGVALALSRADQGIAALWGIVDQSSDPILLHAALSAEIALLPRLDVIPRNMDLEVWNAVGELRLALRDGIEVEIQGPTMPDLLREQLRHSIASLVSPRPIPRSRVLQFDQESLSPLMNPIYRWRNYRAGWAYAIATNFAQDHSSSNQREDIRERENKSKAHLSLLIMKTARKLFGIERGKPPAAALDLVPEFLLSLPLDPFVSPAGPFRERDGIDYSVGRNHVDDGGPDPNYASTGNCGLNDDIVLCKRVILRILDGF